MSRFLSRALFLLVPAASLTICSGMAGAVETWVGSDGEIRVVPGTEDPVVIAPEKPHPHVVAPTAHPAVMVKPKPAPQGPQHAVVKPAKGKPDYLDRRATGQVAPQDPNAANPVDKQQMQPIPPKPGRQPARAAAPVAIDPGNPVIDVDPASDTILKTNEPADDVDPGAGLIAVDPQAPGALPANPVDPTAANAPMLTTRAQATGLQTPGVAASRVTTNGAQIGAVPPATVIDPLTGNPVTAPANATQPATAMRLRQAVPLAGPVQPVQPQPPSGITGSIAQPAQLATTPNPRLGPDDPLTDRQATAYDQVGVRVGSFIWRPAIEVSAGATSNIQSAPGGQGSAALRLAPELIGQSDWSRHQLGIELRGSFTDYPGNQQLFRPTVSANVNGRIDFSDDTRLALKTTYTLDKLPASSALSAAGTSGAGLQETMTGSAGLTRDIGRFALTLRGEVDRTNYQLNQGLNGTTTDASLDNTDLIAALRGTYNLSQGVKPFIEVQTDARRYDAPSLDTPTTPVSHDTTGAALKSGVTLDLGPILTGEASTGYGFETPRSHMLETLRAFTVDENLVWSPTRQTRVTFSTVTAIEPSLIAGASGAVSRTGGIKIADDLFRNLTVDLGASYLDRHYTGVFRTENLAEVTSGLTWKINPKMQTFVRGTFDAFSSSAHTDDYNAATVFAGVRLQQ